MPIWKYESVRVLPQPEFDLWREMNRYHQQYLFKVPNGYCGIGGTGVTCPVGLASGGVAQAGAWEVDLTSGEARTVGAGTT
jgi:hypothetical protein